nr:hypothetical protein [Halonatronum saccharophilum]
MVIIKSLKRQRRKKKNTTKRRKEGRRISDRPKAADERLEVGHWEMDLVEGRKGKESLSY